MAAFKWVTGRALCVRGILANKDARLKQEDVKSSQSSCKKILTVEGY